MREHQTIGIMGASGLIGLQLTYLMLHHPNVSKVVPFSHRLAGKSLAQVYPAFKHIKALHFVAPEHTRLRECDVLFLALPHGKSFPYVKELMHSTARLIDLSSDFRLSDPNIYASVYRRAHPMAENIHRFYNCIPEINGNGISLDSRFISLQGCTSTSVSLAWVCGL